MKKKVLISVGISVLAVILIVVITGLSIIFSRDFSSSLDYSDKVYAEGDGSTVELNVASYNIRGGYTTKDKLNAIREQIKSYDVDIVGLQEVDSDNAPRTHKIKDISTLTSDTYKAHFFASTDSLFLGKNYGIMTMSKTELIEADRLFLPMPNRMFMLKGEPRVCIRTIVNIDGVDVAFYNTHLSFENGVKMKDKSEMRASQIKYIFNTMQNDPCKYRVLVGDMNIMSFDEYDIFKESGEYDMINNASNVLNSYRGDDVTLHALDNIIFTKNMTLIESKLIDNDLSDHNMLLAKLRIN